MFGKFIWELKYRFSPLVLRLKYNPRTRRTYLLLLLNIESRDDTTFIVIGVTGSCHNGIFRCHQGWQSSHHGDSRLSVCCLIKLFQTAGNHGWDTKSYWRLTLKIRVPPSPLTERWWTSQIGQWWPGELVTYTWFWNGRQAIINSCTGFVLGIETIWLYFPSTISNEKTKVVAILPYERQGIIYYQCDIVSIMAADELATSGARASAAMILTYSTWNNPVSVQD